MLRKGMFLADRYEIIEQIGTGGMSDVYKAKCHKLNRYVAIKVMKSEFSEDKTFVSKFRAEAQSVAGFTHPNVVNVYDVGDENGVYYIVMELVEGITLKKYIEKRGKIPFKEAVSIAIQVANGLDAAHKHNIVHRDIKPQNIIISKEGKVKVTDFGIAKVASLDDKYNSIEGVHVSTELKEQQVEVTLEMDFKTANIDTLIESGLLDKGEAQSDYVSLKKTQSAYKQEGFACMIK